MRSLLYTVIFLFLFVPTIYGGLWYFAMWKTQKNLTKVVSYLTGKECDVSHDMSGFPSHLIFHVKLPTDKENPVVDSLLVKNRLFDKALDIYLPSNQVNIGSGIVCDMDSKNHVHIKLNLLPFSSNLPISSNVAENEASADFADSLNVVRYEDYGIKCYVKGQEKGVLFTQAQDSGNYVEFNYINSHNKNVGFKFDSYVYKLVNNLDTQDQDYLSIDTKFKFYYTNDNLSTSLANLDIEKLLIQAHSFSIASNGSIYNYNFTDNVFKGSINIEISNYQELASQIFNNKLASLGSNEKANEEAIKLQEWLLSLADKIIGNDIQLTIRYDDDMQSGFIGKLPFRGFMKSLLSIFDAA